MIKVSERYNTLKEYGITVTQHVGLGCYKLEKDNVTVRYNNIDFLFTCDEKFFEDVIGSFAIYGVELKKLELTKNELIKNDRVELLKTLEIKVLGYFNGDNLSLERYNMVIPYNINNFMYLSVDYLIDDVLRRFREKQLDTPMEEWKKDKLRINQSQIDLLDKEKVKTFTKTISIDDKKKEIRQILLDKGLCSFSE